MDEQLSKYGSLSERDAAMMQIASHELKSNPTELRKKILEEAEQVIIRPEDRDDEGDLLVFPDGPKSHLDELNWKIVRTATFKEWFGDWTQDNASKILDEHGEPLLVYHETSKDFDHFDDTAVGSSNDSGYYGSGHYFATNEGLSGAYSDGEQLIVIKGFLNIRKPFIFDDEDWRTLYYKHLLNRQPKEAALEAARKYIGVDGSKAELARLEAGESPYSEPNLRNATAENEERQKRIQELRSFIATREQQLAELPDIYDELNTQYDGVIVIRPNQQLSYKEYTEIVAFRADQVLITEKTRIS